MEMENYFGIEMGSDPEGLEYRLGILASTDQNQDYSEYLQMKLVVGQSQKRDKTRADEVFQDLWLLRCGHHGCTG